MAAGAWQIPWDVRALGDGTVHWSTGTFMCALHSSSALAGVAASSMAGWTTDAEISTASGYATGGNTMTGMSYTESAGTATFSGTIPNWTASSTSISAYYAYIYEAATGGTIVNPIVAGCILDNTSSLVTVTTGNTLTINSSSGIFTIST